MMCKRNGCKSNLKLTRNAYVCPDCRDMVKGKMTLSVLVRKMINRANERSTFDVNITTEDILSVWPVDNKCPVFGTTFETGGDRRTSPSVDRIDNTKGYELDNIQVISTLANRMKLESSIEEQLMFADWIYRSKSNG